MKKSLVICMILIFFLLLGGVAQGTRGMVKLHFYQDLNGDNIWEHNERSPPWLVIYLRTGLIHPDAFVHRLKLIAGGTAIFRFLPYPATYKVTAWCEYNFAGIGTEIWTYEGTVNLADTMIGARIDLPCNVEFIPTFQQNS
jgi:hypothetical protein